MYYITNAMQLLLFETYFVNMKHVQFIELSEMIKF